MLLCGGDDNVVGDYNMVIVVPMSTMAVVVAILMTIVFLVVVAGLYLFNIIYHVDKWS